MQPKSVETVRGPIDSADLGVVLMHEHIFVFDTEVIQNYPDEWGEEDKRVGDAIERLNELKLRGVDSIVDLTVIGLGRDIHRIQRVAAKTELNIIVATGIYTYNELPHYYHHRGPNTPFGGSEPITEMCIRDIREGIANTKVKAGILKCATDRLGLTADVERILRAVAQAHRQTGVPISTHTFARKRVGLDQQRVFQEEGVDLSRVIIGHSGDTTEIDYLEQLVGAGSYIGMDRFGLDSILTFEQRVETVAKMCRLGYANQMVLSHDAACFNHWLPERETKKALPRWNYLHIHNDVIPALKRAGVTDQELRTMLVENPRKIFERQGGS